MTASTGIKQGVEGKQKKDWTNIILSFSAVIFSLAGLLVIVCFLFSLKGEYQFIGDNPILLDKTAQVGDFIGGLVGSLWAFAGILLFYLALRLQKKEFELQREELKLTRSELSQTRKESQSQSKTMILQRFENTFFNLLQLHHQIVDSIDDSYTKDLNKGSRRSRPSMSLVQSKSDYSPNNVEIIVSGRDVFERTFEAIYPSLANIDLETFNKKYLIYWSKVQTDFGHYFRNLYRIIKLIDTTNFSASDNEDDFYIKYKYTSIVRAQLSDYELVWLLMNCLSRNGSDKFKPLVEKYSLLKNTPINEILMNNNLEKNYAPKAFDPTK